MYVLFTVGFYGPNDLTCAGENFRNQEKHLALIRIKANSRKYQSLGKQWLPGSQRNSEKAKHNPERVMEVLLPHNSRICFHSALLWPLGFKTQRTGGVLFHPHACLVTLKRECPHNIMKQWKVPPLSLLPAKLYNKRYTTTPMPATLSACEQGRPSTRINKIYSGPQDGLHHGEREGCASVDENVAILSQLGSSLGFSSSEDQRRLFLPWGLT